MAENYIEAAKLDDLPPGRGTCVRVDGKDIALFNVDGTVFAINDSCLHQGLSLGTSELKGKVVTCRGHGWQYDVTNGNMLVSPGFGVTPYAVKVVDGKIFVAV